MPNSAWVSAGGGPINIFFKSASSSSTAESLRVPPMPAEAPADALADRLMCAAQVVERELVLGVGIDIESPLAVMRSHGVGGQRWLARLFTPAEASEVDDVLRTSSRFVAKEAVAK